MTSALIDEIHTLVEKKLKDHFQGSYDNVFGITAMMLGKPYPEKLKLINDIKQIVKKYTTNKEIIFYIPEEIDILTNSLIDSMYYSNAFDKLTNKDIVDLIFKTIEKYTSDSEFFNHLFQKDETLNLHDSDFLIE